MSRFDNPGNVVPTNAEKEVRLTGPALRMLKIFVEYPAKEFSGAEIFKVTGIGSGTLYPLLARFEQVKWLASKWEKIDPSEEGRPRRRLYKITPHGQNRARQALAELQTNFGGLVWKS
jgi:PadR family transcriptional regulator PadR